MKKGAKHIDIRFHVVKEQLIEPEQIKVDRVPTEMNTSDNFTKLLHAETKSLFNNTFREDLHLVNLHQS